MANKVTIHKVEPTIGKAPALTPAGDVSAVASAATSSAAQQALSWLGITPHGLADGLMKAALWVVFTLVGLWLVVTGIDRMTGGSVSTVAKDAGAAGLAAAA